MTLSRIETELLAHLELHADTPGPELARCMGVKSATIYRTLDRLIERGVIVGKTAVIDLARLGLVEFGVNLALAPHNDSVYARLLKTLNSHAHVSWVAEVGGEFDLMCNVIAKNSHQAHSLVEEIFGDYSQSVLRRSTCSRSTRLRYPRWLRGLQRTVNPVFSSGTEFLQNELEKTDRSILAALSRMHFESYRDLARQTSIPLATFLRRLKMLTQQKILLGFGYRFDLSKIAVQQFRVLLSFRVPNAAIRAKLRAFAGRERMIKLMVECLGDWDYELEIDQPPNSEVKQLTNLLHREFHGNLVNLSLIPIFKHLRYISFPPV